MMYYKALREGLNELPVADAAVRAAIESEAREVGWPELHRQLSHYDPATAARLAPNDSQRLQRAIEIYRVSGRPMSDWLKSAPARQNDTRQFITVSLEPSDRRSEERRVGKECVSTCRSRWSAYPSKKKTKKTINTKTHT